MFNMEIVRRACRRGPPASIQAIAVKYPLSSNEAMPYYSSLQLMSKSSTPERDPSAYAVAKITPLTTAMPNSPRSLKLTTKNLSIEQILNEAPGIHTRDFFSLALTSVGDARKRRARTVINKIHPWFILPRETEIVVSLIDWRFNYAGYNVCSGLRTWLLYFSDGVWMCACHYQQEISHHF